MTLPKYRVWNKFHFLSSYSWFKIWLLLIQKSDISKANNQNQTKRCKINFYLNNTQQKGVNPESKSQASLLRASKQTKYIFMQEKSTKEERKREEDSLMRGWKGGKKDDRWAQFRGETYQLRSQFEEGVGKLQRLGKLHYLQRKREVLGFWFWWTRTMKGKTL